MKLIIMLKLTLFFSIILYPFVNLLAQDYWQSGTAIRVSKEFAVEKNIDPETNKHVLAKEFERVFFDLASEYNIPNPNKPISVRNLYYCNKIKNRTIRANVVCYSDWFYPVDKFYGLERYRHSLKYYLMAKYLISANLRSKRIGIDAGQLCDSVFFDEDMIDAAALFVQDLFEGRVFVSLDLLEKIWCNNLDKKAGRSGLYYKFLMDTFSENSQDVLNYISVMFGNGKFSNELSKSLNDKWKYFQNRCNSLDKETTKIEGGDYFISGKLPYDIHIKGNVIDLQDVNLRGNFAVDSYKVNISLTGEFKIGEVFYDRSKVYHISSNEYYYILQKNERTLGYLKDKKEKIGVLPEINSQILDFSYDEYNGKLGLLTPSHFFYKSDFDKTKWVKNRISDAYNIRDILSISDISMSHQILITIYNDSEEKRKAVLLDIDRNQMAELFDTEGETFSPKWSKDRKGIVYIERKGETYKVYYLDLIERQYHVLIETKTPLISVDSYDEKKAIAVGLANNGTVLKWLNQENFSQSFAYEEGSSKKVSEIQEKPTAKYTLVMPSDFEEKYWYTKISPYAVSEVEGFLAGLKFVADRYDANAHFDGIAGYNTSPKTIEFFLNANIRSVAMGGGRKLDPIFGGWRDIGYLNIYETFSPFDYFTVMFGLGYKNIDSDIIVSERQNIVGPSVIFKFESGNDFKLKLNYTFFFDTTAKTDLIHEFIWNMFYRIDSKFVDVLINFKGIDVLSDKERLIWPVAGGQLWPIYQDRMLSIQGFKNTAFFEPHIAIFGFETPITLIRNFASPMRSSLNWEINAVPLGNVIISTQKNSTRLWNWSTGGELRLNVNNGDFGLYVFGGAYYANGPNLGRQYNFGGALSW